MAGKKQIKLGTVGWLIKELKQFDPETEILASICDQPSDTEEALTYNGYPIDSVGFHKADELDENGDPVEWVSLDVHPLDAHMLSPFEGTK